MRRTVPCDSPYTVIVPSTCPSALVVCIGNELIADDAVGYEVYCRLQGMELLEGTRLEFAGVGGIALLDHLTGSEQALIVVDAVQFGAPAGTIHQLSWDEIPAFDNAAISAHGIGLKEAVEVGKILCPEKLPSSIMLFGIEGRCFNQTRGFMTPEVAAAVTGAANGIQKYLLDLQ